MANDATARREGNGKRSLSPAQLDTLAELAVDINDRLAAEDSPSADQAPQRRHFPREVPSPPR